MGFQVVLDDSLFLSFLRMDTDRGVCVITIDVRDAEISREPLAIELDYFGISLAEFWNLYEHLED